MNNLIKKIKTFNIVNFWSKSLGGSGSVQLTPSIHSSVFLKSWPNNSQVIRITVVVGNKQFTFSFANFQEKSMLHLAGNLT